VCPASVRTHWAREFAALGWARREPTILSYQQVSLGGFTLHEALRAEGHDALVLDEAHLLRNSEAARTSMLLGRGGYARGMRRVFLASGTPVVKNPSNLWTVLSSCFPEVARAHRLGNRWDFIDRFCVTQNRLEHGYFKTRILPELRNAPEFHDILGAVMLRRTNADLGLDVPELFWQPMVLDVEGVDKGPPIAGLSDEEWADLQNDPEIARLRRKVGEAKVGEVVRLLASQLDDSDEKICVFAHHRSVLGKLRAGLLLFGTAYIDGGTAQGDRDAAIARFASDPSCRVFIGQSQACGTGTDGLQKSGAKRLILVEPDWTAENNLQLAKRLARLGQGSDHVIAQMVTLAGTLDEAIVSRNLRETRMLTQAGLRVAE